MFTLFFSIVTACINNCELFSSSRIVGTCHFRKLEDFFVWFTGKFSNVVQASRWIFRHLLAVYMPMSTAYTWKCGVSLKINKEPWNDSYWSVVFSAVNVFWTRYGNITELCNCGFPRLLFLFWYEKNIFLCRFYERCDWGELSRIAEKTNWNVCQSLRYDLWAFILHSKSYVSQIWSVVCKL